MKWHCARISKVAACLPYLELMCAYSYTYVRVINDEAVRTRWKYTRHSTMYRSDKFAFVDRVVSFSIRRVVCASIDRDTENDRQRIENNWFGRRGQGKGSIVRTLDGIVKGCEYVSRNTHIKWHVLTYCGDKKKKKNVLHKDSNN